MTSRIADVDVQIDAFTAKLEARELFGALFKDDGAT
jgi:hypothetical protein